MARTLDESRHDRAGDHGGAGGARNVRHEGELRSLLAAVDLRSVEHRGSWESAARVYRSCRRAGLTPRSQLDCLIAAVAIREHIPVLHADRDFDLIAQPTPLQVAATD